MRVAILAHGRRLDEPTQTLCAEYIKRARTFLPFELIHCPTAAVQWQRARSDPGIVVLLDERGASLSTPELAARIDRWRTAATRRLCFLIGGADGFTETEREGADWVLSLSQLTLPHRLAQLMLCEQLYRVGTLLAGHPYHHS